jgi:hypothetical protein
MGQRRKVTISQFVGLVQRLPADLQHAAVIASRRAAERLKGYVVEEISENEPYPVVDRGIMRNSVGVIYLKTGAFVTMGAPYAAMMEGGTRPFTPPIEPLIAWATRKGATDPVAMAWAVRRSIQQHGIAPKRYFSRALRRWKKNRVLDSEIRKSLKKMAAERARGSR